MEVSGNSISYYIVKRWCCEFLNGCMEMEDNPHQGWLSVMNKDSINTVQALIEKNGCMTVADIVWYFRDVAYNPLSHRIVVEIIWVHLGMRKICVRWVPKLLDDGHKRNWMATGLDFKSLYHAKREDLFNWIVTGDEKWVYHFTPKMRSALK